MNAITVEKKHRWQLGPTPPKVPDELSFVSRDSSNRRCWWDINAPRTPYTQPHYATGKAMAWELLDYLNGPGAEGVPEILR